MEIDRPQRVPVPKSVGCAYMYLYADIMKGVEVWRREIYLMDRIKKGGVFTLLLRFKQLGIKNDEAQNWAQRIAAGERIDDEKSPAYTEFLDCVRKAKQNPEPYKEYVKQESEEIYIRIDLICRSSKAALEHLPDVTERATQENLETLAAFMDIVLDDINTAVVSCRKANSIFQRIWPFVQQEPLQTGAQNKGPSEKSRLALDLGAEFIILSEGFKNFMRTTKAIKDQTTLSLANPLPGIEEALLQFKECIQKFLLTSKKISERLPTDFDFW